MDEDAGYDVHTLNAEMIEMLRMDCKKTAEKIETDENARWMEEHGKGLALFGKRLIRLPLAYPRLHHIPTARIEAAILAVIHLVKRYTDFSELTTSMLNEFIEKVVVHEGEGSGNDRRQQEEQEAEEKRLAHNREWQKEWRKKADQQKARRERKKAELPGEKVS